MELEQAYVATAQALSQGALAQPAPGYSAMDHAQRMRAIHDWGRQSLERGRQSQQLLDQNHERFMQTLRE